MQPVAKTSSRPAAPRRSRPRGQASCAASASRQQPVAPTRDENRPASISKLKVAGLAALAAVVVGAGGAPDAFANGQSAPNGTVIAGKARVVDGDTLVINGNDRIRLYGVDAPESKQICKLRGADWACGKAAADALQRELDRVGSNNVKCTVVNGDMDVAKCQAANGEDINGWMVSNGWALAYRQYSKDYISVEDKARAGKAGVWQSEFQAPWDWRKDNRATLSQNRPGPQTVSMPAPVAAPRPAPPPPPPAPSAPVKKEVTAPATAPTGCKIKGNIGSSGDKIYHIPGGKYYDQTVINEKQGERYFCTEAEATNAGWRPAAN